MPVDAIDGRCSVEGRSRDVNAARRGRPRADGVVAASVTIAVGPRPHVPRTVRACAGGDSARAATTPIRVAAHGEPRACVLPALHRAAACLRSPGAASRSRASATIAAMPAHVPVPVLETPRLVLRGHRVDDLDDSISLWSDPEVTRHISGKPSTREEVWSRLLRYIGHWAVAGYGLWHIRERASDRFIGEAGLADFKRDMTFSFDGAPEAGWGFAPWCYGRGFPPAGM